MRQITLASVLLALLVTGPGPALAEPIRPVFHEDVVRAWGEVTEHLLGLASSLERHLTRGMGGSGWGGPRGVRPSPAERPLISFMLEHREEIGLTPDQASRLEALRTEFARDAIPREADIQVAELDLATLLEQNPVDMAKVAPQVRQIALLRAELRLARLRILEAGKAVLTAEQRARLEELLASGRTPRRAAGRPTRL